jgi:nucleoid-associated protein YgaU
MGLIQFAKDVGRKLRLGDDEPQQPAGGAGQHPSTQQVQELHDRRRAAALVKVVEQMGFKVDDFSVRVDGSKAVLKGKAASQEEREKVALLVGNHEGIGEVDDQMTVGGVVGASAQGQGQFYTVVKGDTLSKIAKQHYGDANAYHRIFEANRPLLKDPDEIYPGQVLRIPAEVGAPVRA